MASEHESTPPLSRAEFNDYIVYHSHKLSPKDLQTLVDQLTEVRKGFPEIKTPDFPHTPQRLEFLTDVVDAFVAGKAEALPFESAAEAAFAVIYVHQEMDIIPDFLPEIGFTDDATIVSLVLERNAPAFRSFAEQNSKDWDSLAVTVPGPETP